MPRLRKRDYSQLSRQYTSNFLLHLRKPLPQNMAAKAIVPQPPFDNTLKMRPPVATSSYEIDSEKLQNPDSQNGQKLDNYFIAKGPLRRG